jgi:transposase
MSEIIGLDIAKSIFQAHGVDAEGRPDLKRRLSRAEVLPFFQSLPPALVGMEACATSHHWAREIASCGHDVRLIPPSYVKAYVKRDKSDLKDAEAICEAVGRPTMRFAKAKTIEQQGLQSLHRTRQHLLDQCQSTLIALRALMAEFGLVEARGRRGASTLLAAARTLSELTDGGSASLAFKQLADQHSHTKARVDDVTSAIQRWHDASQLSQRLATIPGVGFLCASALTIPLAEPGRFTSGRAFAAYLGLVPKQRSSGGVVRLGRISKAGDRHLRSMLVMGSISCLRHGRSESGPYATWIKQLRERRPGRVVAVALANRNARIAWALAARGGEFVQPT